MDTNVIRSNNIQMLKHHLWCAEQCLDLSDEAEVALQPISAKQLADLAEEHCNKAQWYFDRLSTSPQEEHTHG